MEMFQVSIFRLRNGGCHDGVRHLWKGGEVERREQGGQKRQQKPCSRTAKSQEKHRQKAETENEKGGGCPQHPSSCYPYCKVYVCIVECVFSEVGERTELCIQSTSTGKLNIQFSFLELETAGVFPT